MRERRQRQQGVTLVETAIVIAVIALIAAAAVPGLGGLISSHRLDSAARQLADDIHLARVEALARRQSVRLTVQAAAGVSCYLVHTGAANQCRCAVAPVGCSPGAIPIRSVVFADATRLAVAANVGSMLFDSLHGTVSPTGTWRVSDGSGRVVQHVVNIVGRVRSCAAGVPVTGYSAC